MNDQYIIQFDSDKLPRIETDFLVIGSGSAGLRAAIEANKHGDVVLITKSVLKESNTRYAQGGIAVAMSEEDTIDAHVEDTLKAGVGLCDETAVQVMVEEGIQRVAELIEWGANFDRDGNTLGFTMEAAHQRRRIIHRGDATGQETTDVLVNQLNKQERIRIIEHAFAIDLMTQGETCCGAVVLICASSRCDPSGDDQLHCIFAKATIIAAGGLGCIYQCTSNPDVATGDGYALAWRAGCEMIDMEFVQFHPTTLFLTGAPPFLISEAVRGEGGILLNIYGERFMTKYHIKEELAPRDVVSRSILNEMQLTNFPCVYLDITHLPSDFIQQRFPTIYHTCKHYGIDITTDLIPVRSGAHFMMGGIRTNLKAETNIRGLYACGEVACTGVHGANRLASNSLLECIVFGTRAGQAAVEYAQTVNPTDRAKIHSESTAEGRSPTEAFDPESVKETIRELMWNNVGIIREDTDLETTLEALAALDCTECHNHIAEFEGQNMLDVAKLVTEAAMHRTESRGAHYRRDFPDPNDTLLIKEQAEGSVLSTARGKKRIVFRRNQQPEIV